MRQVEATMDRDHGNVPSRFLCLAAPVLETAPASWETHWGRHSNAPYGVK